MLKGKMVLTTNFFGTVLEETETTVTIQSIRRRVANNDLNDPIRRMYGVPDPDSYWYEDNTERVLAWESAGDIEVCETVPAFLEEACLGYKPPPLFLTTVIDGRSYIDW